MKFLKKILTAEGFIKSNSESEDGQTNSSDKYSSAKAGDVVTYQDADGTFVHFELFVSDKDVDTKGGVQKGPVIAKPGENKAFGDNTQLYKNTNPDNHLDPKVSTKRGEKSGSSGLNSITSKEARYIQRKVKKAHTQSQ